MPTTSSATRLFSRLSLIGLIAAAPVSLWAEPPASAPASSAPAADLPSAQSIIDRFIEATGGRAAHERITTRASTGKFEMPAMGLSAKLSMLQAAPYKMRLVIEADSLGKIDSGTNGEIAWESNAMTGPRILSDAERDQFMRGAIFHSDLRITEIYPKMETVGVEAVDGRECYKVVLTPSAGSPITNFYDKESGLVVKSQTKQQTQMGEITSESIPSDWKEVDGIKQPHLTTIKAMGMEQRLVIDKIEQNIALPADAFDPPAEVKALNEPKTEAPAAPDAPKTEPKNIPEQPK